MGRDKPLRNERKRVLSLLTLLEFRPVDLTACIAPTSWLSSVCLDRRITQRVIFSLARLGAMKLFSYGTDANARIPILTWLSRVFSRQRIFAITIQKLRKSRGVIKCNNFKRASKENRFMKNSHQWWVTFSPRWFNPTHIILCYFNIIHLLQRARVCRTFLRIIGKILQSHRGIQYCDQLQSLRYITCKCSIPRFNLGFQFTVAICHPMCRAEKVESSSTQPSSYIYLINTYMIFPWRDLHLACRVPCNQEKQGGKEALLTETVKAPGRFARLARAKYYYSLGSQCLH